ncbi:unnamed protein product [Prorocentrum cordatum]|uniref:Uncharacterized protein n=1 Tax=Prorocentrum cordatum TaxID=2364126 RepID=A0ABN9S8U4_9DINO|nr:unnamed protein product [Polarella glacialis]
MVNSSIFSSLFFFAMIDGHYQAPLGSSSPLACARATSCRRLHATSRYSASELRQFCILLTAKALVPTITFHGLARDPFHHLLMMRRFAEVLELYLHPLCYMALGPFLGSSLALLISSCMLLPPVAPACVMLVMSLAMAHVLNSLCYLPLGHFLGSSLALLYLMCMPLPLVVAVIVMNLSCMPLPLVAPVVLMLVMLSLLSVPLSANGTVSFGD